MDEASTSNRNILFHIMVEVKKIKSKGAGGTAKFEKKEIKKGETVGGVTNVTPETPKPEE